MPQVRKGPRLYLHPQKGVWYIRDGKFMPSCLTKNRDEAERILAAYVSCPKHFRTKQKRRRGRVDPRKLRWLYFAEIVAEGRPVKVGVADDVRARLWNISVGSSPFEIRLLASIEVPHAIEAQVHEMLAHTRIRGEWFSRSLVLNWMIMAAQDGTLLAKIGSQTAAKPAAIGDSIKEGSHASH